MLMPKNFRNLFLAVSLVFIPAASSFAQVSVGVSIRLAPPALPVYTQPPCPAEGYLWTPGYWAYAPAGYYWVPGVWVRPPRVGLLWTPGYWGFAGGAYAWHAGYWGSQVGFYGGVNYGFGYVGRGFVGGVWAGNGFRYNTAVTNVNNTVVHNTYVNRTVINNTTVNRTSFNGPGGVSARPTSQEQGSTRQQHWQPTTQQVSHQQMASTNHTQFASANGGRPETTAMNTVNGRRYNQQGRIANGIASGQLNPREAQHLENRQGNLNQEVRGERRANGGRLTPDQRQQVNRQQNRDSRRIEEDRHNGRREPR